LIVRLEIKAASLQSRLDEHHSELKNNSDELVQLKKFHRKAGDNFIHINKDMLQLGTGTSYLVFNGEIFAVNINTSNLIFELAEYKHEKLIQIINENSKIILKDDKILIEAKGDISIGSPGKKFGYSKSEDNIIMKYDDSRIYLGKFGDAKGNPISKGILLEGKKNGPTLMMQENRITLVVPSKDGDYKLYVDPTEEIVGMKLGQSEIIIKKDNIKIEALGDINITSKNGKVNINGKR